MLSLSSGSPPPEKPKHLDCSLVPFAVVSRWQVLFPKVISDILGHSDHADVCSSVLFSNEFSLNLLFDALNMG